MHKICLYYFQKNFPKYPKRNFEKMFSRYICYNVRSSVGRRVLILLRFDLSKTLWDILYPRAKRKKNEEGNKIYMLPGIRGNQRKTLSGEKTLRQA